MDKTPSEVSGKPSPQLYPTPDFSIPPPAIQKTRKTCPEATTKTESSNLSSRESSKRGRPDDRRHSREREKTRCSPRPSSSRDSRDYRSQSRYSTSSRYSGRDYNSRRSDDRTRESFKRQRSLSRSSLRKSPQSYRSSSRKSPSSNQDRKSRPRRSPPQRAARNSRDAPISQRRPSKNPQTERERLLVKWRKNYCETSEQISKKLQELAHDEEQVSWIRASPADIHYRRSKDNTVESTPRLDALCSLFDEMLSKRAERARAIQTPYNPPLRRRKIRVCRHKCELS